MALQIRGRKFYKRLEALLRKGKDSKQAKLNKKKSKGQQNLKYFQSYLFQKQFANIWNKYKQFAAGPAYEGLNDSLRNII